MKINIKEKSATNYTFEGAKVGAISAEAQLARMTLAHMLWEDQFYIDGKTSADIIGSLVAQVSPLFVGTLAEKARNQWKLRHIPLLLLRELARYGKLQAKQLTSIIERPDEISEFLAIYWKDGKTPIANQVKKGLANAFHKFNEFQLSKYNRNSSAVSLRDVLFMVRAKPNGREELFTRIANNELAIADTWETALSAGADKKETFSRLMSEGRLGALAFLRNLRNMVQSGISEEEIRAYAKKVNIEKVLPFRYIAAARVVPQFEDMLEEMMLRSLKSHEKLLGKTVLLVDVSGSMWMSNVSAKSDLSRYDAAAALAMLCREVCENVEIYTFSNNVVRVPARRGFALNETLYNSQSHNGTYLKQALDRINSSTSYDRIIIFTDEQVRESIQAPKGLGYIINVAAYKNGINRGDYLTITGFSEAVIDFIQEIEKV